MSYDAALLSQAVGKPVRVQLSRQDEMAWENYGFAYRRSISASALDADGTIVAWDYESLVADARRPARHEHARQRRHRLARRASSRQPFTPRRRRRRPDRFDNGSNAAPSYVTGCVGGGAAAPAWSRASACSTHTVESPFFTGSAAFAGAAAEHVCARVLHRRDRRAASRRIRSSTGCVTCAIRDCIEVVTAAAKAAEWEARPSPRAGLPRGPASPRGRGIACVLYEGDNGYCAMVAEVEVNQDTGVIVVKRCVVAMDSGPISNPDGMRNQIEGGTLQGISRTLLEEVTWDTERVTSVDWRTYRPLYLGAEVPKIESVLINRTDVAAMGAGETAMTVTAAAIGNAIFDATGARLREVPFTPERVKAALRASRAG